MLCFRCLPTITLIAAVALVAACSASRVVKPLPEGRYSLTAAAGGPFIDYAKMTIPMPLSSVAAAYGAREDTTVYAGLHTTALIYGVVQSDIGALYAPYTRSDGKLGVTVGAAANVAIDTWQRQFRFYPSLDIDVYHEVFDRPDYVYYGIANWFELRRTRTGGEPQQTHWVPALQTGYTHVRDRWRYTGEMKWLAPAVDNSDVVVHYYGIAHRGALGLYFSAMREF